MDPFSALSLASTIVQLVDVGTRVVSAGFELYSANGIFANEELETIMNDLTTLCSSLKQPQNRLSGQVESRSERELIPLSVSCRKLGEELLTVLHNLKVQSPHGKWQSFRQA